MDAGLHEKDIVSDHFPFRLIVNAVDHFVWPLHWHNAVEIIYVLKNGFAITLNNQKCSLDESDIVFIPGGRLHGFDSNVTAGSRVIINYDFSVIRDCFPMGQVNMATQDFAVIAKRNDPDLHRKAEECIRRMMEEYEEKAPAYPLALAARALDFMTLLNRSLSDRVEQAAAEDGRKVSGLAKIREAFAYIEHNYMNDLSLAEVARAAGFSEYHFSRIFKQITDKNFSRYLTEFRLQKAEQQLMGGQSSVAAVAYASGFNSIATFERLFKRFNGCTPLEYRKLGLDH